MRLPKDGTGKNVNINIHVRDEDSMMKYLIAFFEERAEQEEPVKYRRYVRKNGWSTAQYVKSLPTQGLLKTVVAAIKVITDKSMSDDPQAKRALRLIKTCIRTAPQLSRQDQINRAADVLRSAGVRGVDRLVAGAA
jgi:hypothetical protein